MKKIIFLLLSIILASCASSPKQYQKRSVHYEDPVYGIRVIEKSEVWKPESNCKMIKYVRISGNDIQRRGRGYEDAIRSLSVETRRLRGTLAKVRDYTDSMLFAWVWFCSDDYSFKSQK